MTRDDQGWSTWDSISRLAASTASSSVAVGYLSLGAAIVVGRAAGGVLQGALRVLDQIAITTTRTEAIVVGRRTARKSTKRSRHARAAEEPRVVMAGEELEVASTGVGPFEDAIPTGVGSESQWIVWPDAACEAEWAGVAFKWLS